MRKTLKQLLSLLLVLTMVASFTVTGWAVESTDKGSTAPAGTELEMEDLNPATLHIPKLGEVEDVEEEAEEITFSPNDIVRVSIFLDKPATLDAGYAMEGVATNSAAVSYRESLRRQQSQVTAAIEKATGTELDVKWNMTLAVNAISANVRYMDIVKIGVIDGVKKVVMENRYEAPDDEVAEPNTANTSENMVGAVDAWTDGYTGFKSRIAIIDTGIDTSHKSFDDDAFLASINETGETLPAFNIPSGLNGNGVSFGNKIPYGYNYVDGNTTITHTGDTQGNHGSHVAGIAAANRYVKSGSSYVLAKDEVGAVGMAPDAQLLVMKVFGSSGGAYDSDYMVAIEDAIAMECDAVNLSLGSAVQGFTFSDEYQDIMNNLVDKAKNEGTVVSISAGNSYDFAYNTASGNLYKDDVYYHTGGTPGTFVNSLCVAAAQNTLTKGTPMNFNGSQDVYYYESTKNEEEGTTYTNPELTTIVGSYQYVYIDATGSADDYSAVNGALSLSGKIVIVNRGELSFVEKGENAKSYNPKAVIIANNKDGTIYMDLSDFTGTFPMVTITLKDANTIKANSTAHTVGDITYYTGSVEVTNVEKSVVIDRSEATITDFSSWGVPGSLLMKPEITAPGGDIYSVNGTAKTSSGSTGGSDQYVNMSGTSMAAPHITGLTAVLAQYLRENPIADRNEELADKYSTRAIMQSLLMSTATAMRPEGEYLSILQQGAGLVDVHKAITSPSVIMMGETDDNLTAKTGAAADGKVKVELGDDPARNGSYSYSFTIYNLSDQPQTYELNTDLFTQKISGEFLARGTTTLPAGGVEYAWEGAAAASEGVSLKAEQSGNNVVVTLTADANANFGGFGGSFEFDTDAFTYQSATSNVLDVTYGKSSNLFTVDTSGSVDVTAGTVLLTITLAKTDKFKEGKAYTFSVQIDDAFDSELEDLPWAGLLLSDSYMEGEPIVASFDVNGDGNSDDADIQLVLEYLAGNVEDDALDLDVADMDSVGGVTSYDAYLMADMMAAGGDEGGDSGDDTGDDGADSNVGVVAANGSATVTVTINLTAEQKAVLADYAKGAYLEGFTYVTTEVDGVEHVHSIPVLGFYGSWTDPSMFDNMSYVDGLYGADRDPYSGTADTNYLMLNVNGTNTKFSGNPYMVEDAFPADRLAINSNSTLLRLSYNLIRAAGTTGFAVTKLDQVGGNVTDVVSASVTGTGISGQYYSATAGWQNTGTKVYSVNKTVSSYGFNEGDAFRVGYYAIPEYNGMVINETYDQEDSGMLSNTGFQQLLTGNTLGRGAFVGYDFTVDNTAPEIETAVLNGNEISVAASDNQNLAYVAVLSLDGTVKYAEKAPGSETYTITFDASDAIANASGYVAVFAGDYAGNEAAKAVKVNNNTHVEKTVFVLSSTLTAGNDYLVVSSNANTGYGLAYTTPTSTNATTATATTYQATIHAGIGDTGNQPYIDSADVPANGVWTASSGVTLTNASGSKTWYIGRSNSNNLTIGTSPANRNWSYTDSRLRSGNSTRYLYYSGSAFTVGTATTPVYLYQKTTITYDVDPYGVSNVTITPAALDLYKGNSADLTAKVLPLTAQDRTVTWSSSDTSVATVDASGHVEAKAAGSATITATANGDSTKSASCSVKVTSVDKTLNGIVWDEQGGVYFSDFNTSTLPGWNKLHSEAKTLELQSAFMADSSTLYAGTMDSSASTVLYTVNRNTYDLTEYGTNYVGAFGMARASTRYTGYFVYGFAKYLIFGNLAPEEDGDETFSGLPYGLLDLSTTDVGDAYVCSVCARNIGTTSSGFYFLDENGKIWQTTMTISSSVSFSTPTLVVDTGIGTSMMYQGLYYDGTYLYWGHQADNVAEMIIINPTTQAVYHAGDFGEGVWPATGFYVDGAAAPASVEDEEPARLDGLTVLASRDELLTADVQARLAAEAQRVSKNKAGAESAAFGGLNAIRAQKTVTDAAPASVTDPVTDDEGVTSFDLTETVGVHNGLIAIGFDTDVLTFQGIDTSNLAYSAYNVDDKGVITLAYAMADELEAGEAIATLRFTAACEDGEVEITTLERNSELELNENVYNTVEGTGHEWSAPVWSWTEDFSAATATFTCANDDSHMEIIDATVTAETTEPAGGQDGKIVYTATVTGPDGNTYTDTREETLPFQGPQIVTQPADVTAPNGTITSFTVEASGDGLTYQWQVNPTGSAKWVNSTVTSGTTTTLKVSATTVRDGYRYRCVVTDAYGNQVISDVATLHVTDGPAITTQPQDVTAGEGKIATFTVVASGEDLTYQWQVKTTGSDKWVNSTVASGKTNALKVSATMVRNGYEYRCVVTDANGGSTISQAAMLHVAAKPVIVTQPVDAAGMVDEKAVFTVEAVGEGLTYQWQVMTATGTTWSNSKAPGYNTAELTVTILEIRDGQKYRCVVKDQYGNSVTSDVVVMRIRVGEGPEITTQPEDITVLDGKTGRFTVEAVGENLTYQWQVKTTSSSRWVNSTVESGTTPTLKVAATLARNGYQYRCIVTDAEGGWTMSDAATLTVLAAE